VFSLKKASYPPEEISWLLASAWDRGVERQIVDWPEAKKWCEMAIAFAPFAPSGMELQAQVCLPPPPPPFSSSSRVCCVCVDGTNCTLNTKRKNLRNKDASLLWRSPRTTWTRGRRHFYGSGGDKLNLNGCIRCNVRIWVVCALFLFFFPRPTSRSLSPFQS
jgi:hypothetical protein